MSSGKKFITTIFDVFGYSLIGIMAYCFGLVLQNYDSQGKFFAELVSYKKLAPAILLLICFQIVFICLFGFSYAKVFFYRVELNQKRDSSENFKEIYKITGNWIEVILLCLFIAIVVYQIINPSTFKMPFWFAISFSGLPFIISAMVYRMKSRDSSLNKTKWIKETKYVLVCPAILMIGVNTYLGSSVLELLDGNVFYYYPIILFLLFFTAFFISSKKSYDITLYISFIILIIIVAMLTYNKALSMPSKNMFLAVMLSIFLSIYECWYIAFRQLKDKKNRNFVRVTSYIIAASPPVVLILYPLQEFGIIYFISFVLGMILTQFIWFLYILPNAKETQKRKQAMKLRQNTGVLRAVFGILVLVFLTLDKHVKINMQYSPNNEKLYKDYGFLLNALEVVLAFFSLIVASGKTQHIKNNVSYYKNLMHVDIIALYQVKLGVYIFTAIILSIEQHFVSTVDIYKYSVVFYGFIVFVLIDLATFFYIINKGKNSKVCK